MHEKTTVPALIEEIYTFLRQADARELGGMYRDLDAARAAGDKAKEQKLIDAIDNFETHVVPMICDIDAGFGNAEATYLLAKKMIEAGACAIQIENQVSDEKQCGHQDGKVTVPHEDFLAKVRACRYAFLELGVEDGIIVTRPDPPGAGLTKQNPLRQEPGDLGLQRLGLKRHLLGGREHVRGGPTGFTRSVRHPGDIGRDIAGSNRGLMDELIRAIEATLFASAEPLSIEEIAEHVGDGEVEIALGQLAAYYEGRGIELVERGGRWHFQTAPDLAHLLRRTREEPRRLSRAATETLAIIAYHEPVSRAEIEAIRGVQISKGTLDVLMEAGWVRTAGRREGPGRPLLYATTPEFLTHFGLGSRKDLPGIDDLKAAGLLDPLEQGVFEALGQLQLESEEEED
jgi:segregation and condensation protein B